MQDHAAKTSNLSAKFWVIARRDRRSFRLAIRQACDELGPNQNHRWEEHLLFASANPVSGAIIVQNIFADENRTMLSKVSVENFCLFYLSPTNRKRHDHEPDELKASLISDRHRSKIR